MGCADGSRTLLRVELGGCSAGPLLLLGAFEARNVMCFVSSASSLTLRQAQDEVCILVGSEGRGALLQSGNLLFVPLRILSRSGVFVLALKQRPARILVSSLVR